MKHFYLWWSAKLFKWSCCLKIKSQILFIQFTLSSIFLINFSTLVILHHLYHLFMSYLISLCNTAVILLHKVKSPFSIEYMTRKKQSVIFIVLFNFILLAIWKCSYSQIEKSEKHCKSASLHMGHITYFSVKISMTSFKETLLSVLKA